MGVRFTPSCTWWLHLMVAVFFAVFGTQGFAQADPGTAVEACGRLSRPFLQRTSEPSSSIGRRIRACLARPLWKTEAQPQEGQSPVGRALLRYCPRRPEMRLHL
jgi:hypothetical protein